MENGVIWNRTGKDSKPKIYKISFMINSLFGDALMDNGTRMNMGRILDRLILLPFHFKP